MNRIGLPLALLIVAVGLVLLLRSLGSGSESNRGGVASPVESASPVSPEARSAPRLVEADPAPAPDGAPSATRVAVGRSGSGGPSVYASAEKSLAPSLIGKVVAGRGPVPGAGVALTSAEGRLLAEAATDRGGGFRLDLPGPVEGALLVIRARGHAPLETGPHFLRAGERRYLGNVRVHPGLMLSGTVRGPSGDPVGGARVRLRAGGPAGGYNRHVQEATTDTAGTFRFPEAASGVLRVEAFAEGLGSRALEVRHMSPEDTVELRLVVETSLFVRLSEKDGNPVPGAAIHIRSRDPDSPEHDATTDERGRAAFRGLGAPLWEIRVNAPGYRPVAQANATADGNEIVLEIEAWPCIAGRVSVPGGGAPPPGTRIKALPSNARGGFLDQPGSSGVEVGEDGRFRLCDVRPGVFAIRAEAPGWAPTTSDAVRVSLRGDSEGVSIVLAKGGELVVAVTYEGEPIAGAAVEVYDFAPRPAELWRTESSPLPPPSAWPLAVESTGDDGKIAVEHLAGGDYWCLVRAEALLPEISGPYTVREGARTATGPIALMVGGTIRGRITDAQGAGVARVLVTLIGQGQIAAPIQLETDEQGGFTSPMLPPGSYRVTARVAMETVQPTRSATAQVEVEEGAVQKVDLEL